MVKRSQGIGPRHTKILVYMERYQKKYGYPPAIREICEETEISSTSVVNYYLEQLEGWGYIKREKNISRGITIIKDAFNKLMDESINPLVEKVETLVRIPVVGRIVAGLPVPVPASDLAYFDPESAIDIARSMLPQREKMDDLFALEVQGESMIDAMVNDGDVIIMKKATEARNGEMVAVWLLDKDETTLKYFYHEGSKVRLQPANKTMQPIIIDDPKTIQIQGKVLMVVRRLPVVG
ncbi:MAG: repressor LexA [Anaerolinea sp.]|nr:repressor LexA [Anaerolinea sp.]